MNIGDKYYVCINGVTEEKIATAEDVAEEAENISSSVGTISELRAKIAYLERAVRLLLGDGGSVGS